MIVCPVCATAPRPQLDDDGNEDPEAVIWECGCCRTACAAAGEVWLFRVQSVDTQGSGDVILRLVGQELTVGHIPDLDSDPIEWTRVEDADRGRLVVEVISLAQANQVLES